VKDTGNAREVEKQRDAEREREREKRYNRYELRKEPLPISVIIGDYRMYRWRDRIAKCVCCVECVCVECLIGKQKKPILFKVT
jgi:hypothetical protein